MRKLGPIQALDSGQDPDAPWVILFHGYGADAFDLHGLADLIPTTKPVNYLFPQGPLEVPIGPGWTGRAWWPIDMARIQADMQQGIERDTGLEVPPTLPAMREKAMKMIAEMRVPWDRLIIGGFSQGGMLAADVALHAPVAPRGLILLSTALINKEEMRAIAPSKAGTPFFQSHGENDQVLRFKNGARLETLLTQAGLKGKLTKFPGAHEIPPNVVHALGKWIDERN